MTATPSPARSRTDALPWITWGKALASQLIVWHHLALYGPLAASLRAEWPALARWLQTQALLSVQVFLVIGGFLAARALWPAPDAPRVTLAQWPLRVARRWWRLMPLYAVALLAAILAAALARAWMRDADTPAAPTLTQLDAHLLLLQDIAQQPALSAGVWYVAIDLQLFALLAALAVVSGWLAPHSASLRARRAEGVALLALGVAASLLVFNRLPQGEVWAPYFLGAYGLGVLAAWGRDAPAPVRRAGTVALAALLALALWIDWRSRVLVAGLTALLLLWQPGRAWLARPTPPRAVQWLARISFAVFLLHYPISLVVSAVVVHSWPHRPHGVDVAALGFTWLASLALGTLAWRWVEDWPHRRAQRAPAAAKAGDTRPATLAH